MKIILFYSFIFKFIRELVFVLTCALFVRPVLAADQPVVGRKAAAKYFEKDVAPAPEKQSRGSGSNFLMLHLGTFQNSTAWKWKGDEKRSDLGSGTYGLTYFIGDYGQSMDFSLRVDFNEYKLDDVRPVKISLLPLLTFPKAETHFPLYFGIGAGIGVFTRQVEDESNLSFDYQLMMGARFMDVIENFGFFAEFGMKNHLQLLSDGQFNGNALSAGAVFSF